MRARPDSKVKGWVAAQNIRALFLSVVSIGELEAGFTTMRDAGQRARLEASLERHLTLLLTHEARRWSHATASGAKEKTR